MPRIFVSYRRSDSAGHVGWLTMLLRQRFGADSIFRDLETIEAGSDFVEAIEAGVASCDVVLAVIGPHWLNATSTEGRRRLDDPRDFVRLELATALGRRIRVIPLLVGGSSMPSAQELPQELALLTRRNALELSDSRWEFDVGRLIQLLEHEPRDVDEATVTAAGAGNSVPISTSSSTAPGNLPPPPTPFVGRETEIAAVSTLLRRPDVRLVTLTGPGGMGKTRLAFQVAGELRPDFPDGVWYVALASISDPDLVAPTIAQTLGLKEASGQTLVDSLKAYLRDRQLLLVLDNFEQVVKAAPAVTELLTVASGLKVMVTSRAVLYLSAEHEFPVPPLPLPPTSQVAAGGSYEAFEDLSNYAAVDLFVRRAKAVKPDFQLTAATAPAVVECCKRLDGLPLAIELAAARCRLLAPQAIVQRLEQRLKLLTGGARDLPTRQQTLRGAIDWSYNLLDEQEQRLFARLSVFVGGCTFEAIEAVSNAGTDLELDILDGVESLVSKSLIQRIEQPDGDVRLLMLQTLREYALERLVTFGESDQQQHYHAEYFVALAEEAEPELTRQEQERWLHRLEREHDNFRAVFDWSLKDSTTDPETRRLRGEFSLRLAGALWRFWETRGYVAEGRKWLRLALEQAPPAQAPETLALRAKALNGAGNLAWAQGDYSEARAFHEESLTLRRELGETSGIATALGNLGIVARDQGDYAESRALEEESLALRRKIGDKRGIATSLNSLAGIVLDQADFANARALYTESLALLRDLGDKRGVAYGLGNLGVVALNQGDPSGAQTSFEESLALRRELGDKRGVATVLNNLGVLAFDRGDVEAAKTFYEESLALRRELGDKQGVATALGNLGQIALDRQEFATAQALYTESLNLYRDLVDVQGSVECLEGLAGVASALGQAERAARLGGALDHLWAKPTDTLAVSGDSRCEQCYVAIQPQIDEATWAALWIEGRTMAIDEVIRYALGEP